MFFSEGAQQQAEPGIARDEWKIQEVGGLCDFFSPLSFVFNPKLTNAALLFPCGSPGILGEEEEEQEQKL